MKTECLKIGFVLDDSLDKVDGVQQYVLTVGAWLSSRGHEVHYLVGQSSRQDIHNLHSLARNWRVRYNGNSLSVPLPANKRRLRQVLGQYKFDVLHVQAPYSPLLAGRLMNAAGPNTAIVATFHVLPYDRSVLWANRALALANRRTGRLFDAVISNSQPTSDFVANTFHLQSQVIANPFPLAKFEVTANKTNDTPNILFLGRLEERKGVMRLLRAVAYMRSQHLYAKPFHVTVGGKGRLLHQLTKYVQQAGLDDVVSFSGYVAEADKAAFLATADVAVFPSISGESFGISLLEALAASGGVVLGGDNPGYRTVLEPVGQNQLFNPRDERAFATTLAYWLDRASERAAAARHQKEYVRQFDIGQIGPQILQVYNEALRAARNVR